MMEIRAPLKTLFNLIARAQVSLPIAMKMEHATHRIFVKVHKSREHLAMISIHALSTM
jgi:hypothetical protein